MSRTADTKQPTHVLVRCTGNSARSILGEVLINELGAAELSAALTGIHASGDGRT